MLDAATAYPMLKRRRRARWWTPNAVAVRRLALAVVALALLGSGAWWWTRPAPADARALLARSLAAMRAGDWHAAANAARQAAAAQPSAGVLPAVLARAELELDHGAAAEAALGRATAAGFPESRLHQLVAHARLLQGDADGAVTAAGAAAPPYVGYAARILARALAASGRPAAARAALETLVSTAPADGEAWTDLGRVQFAQGDVGDASASAVRAARLMPASPRALTLMGEVVGARYGLVSALSWYRAALRRDPRDHAALIDEAATLGELGRNVEMLAVLRAAAAAEPNSPEPFYLQAVLAARAGKHDLAAGLLARGVALPGATLLSGALDYAAGRYQQAAVKWRDLSAVQPMNVVVRRLLGAALLRSGDAAGALVVLRPLAIRGDADGDALLLAARAFEATGDRISAARYLDRAAGARTAPATFGTDQTVATLALGAASAPTDPTYAVGLIRGLFAEGDVAGALARARALAVAAPGAPDAQLAEGDALAVAGRDPIAAYARAANLRFDEPAMLRLVDAQSRGRSPRDAATTLSLYLQQNPQSLVGRRMLGRLQLRAGRWDAAIETLEGVRGRVGSADAALLVDLALAYAGGGDAATAQRYARAAYLLQPMNADAADAYGVALAASGRTAQARQLLDKAVILAPADRAIAAHRRQLG